MNYVKISLVVLLTLSASRFIPHPPNFTSLLALSFYIPMVFGFKFIPAVVLSLIFTDLILGFHSTILFTWGSVILIGLLSKFFNVSILVRIFGALLGAVIFFVLTNFGVWLNGFYGYTIDGLINCYILAIPFFSYSIISTLFFSAIIETFYKLYKEKKKKASVK